MRRKGALPRGGGGESFSLPRPRPSFGGWKGGRAVWPLQEEKKGGEEGPRFFFHFFHRSFREAPTAVEEGRRERTSEERRRRRWWAGGVFVSVIINGVEIAHSKLHLGRER